jgi:tetratricopeptide (TPR) repeat protein
MNRLRRLVSGHCIGLLLGLLLLAGRAQAQTPEIPQPADTSRKARPVKVITLDTIDVVPGAIDYSGWLLLDKDIATELDGAVQNLYNFKYDKAERQFRSLRRRYPNHPMPYFLMGLSTWWKIVPTNVQTKLYDKTFYAYMDTTIAKAEKLYDKDDKNYEACFFLSAAYGFAGRLQAERGSWPKATVSARRALKYLELSKEANGLSPEFLFGQALFNYYAVWIPDNYPLLKPVLLLFPKGNKALGLQQLRSVADNGVYVGPEAKVFLMRILNNEEGNSTQAMPLARNLAAKFPDNGYFQRFYALLSFNEGEYRECERVSREILDKINRGMPGYEGISGRYATYFMGWLMQNKYKDLAKAKDYYQRCIVFSEATEDTRGGFYLFANLNLARMADKAGDIKEARRYYAEVADIADNKSANQKEAKAYLKVHKAK